MKKLSIVLATLLTSFITFQTVFAAKWGLEELTTTGLPQDAPGAFIARIVSYALGFIGILLIVMIIYGGFLYMTSHGNEKQTESAKSVLTYAVIGVIIIFASYIISRLVITALTAGSSTAPTSEPAQQSNCYCVGGAKSSETSSTACTASCTDAGSTVESYKP